MKKIVTGGLFLLAGLFACNGSRKETVDFTDSFEVQEVIRVDTLKDERLYPTDADGIFDDFMYLFSTDYDFQRSRIGFPIRFSSYKGDSVWIQENDWQHDSLLIGKTFYTLLFDRESDLESVNDTSQTQARVEWYNMKNRELKSYLFEKDNGVWLLTSICLQSLHGLPEEEFVDFFGKFVNDSLFQAKHIREPLEFVTADPDDDFAILSTTLDLNQWFAFRPMLPLEMLSNIRMGERRVANSRIKIVSIKGNGNGISCTLFFRRKSNRQWELYKYEDVSI